MKKEIDTYVSIIDINPFDPYPWDRQPCTPEDIWDEYKRKRVNPKTITSSNSLYIGPLEYTVVTHNEGRIMTMLVPGINSKDIKITLNKLNLSIKTNIQEKHTLIKDKTYEFTLQPNEEVVETSLDNGVLTIKTKVTVPKSNEEVIPIGLKRPQLLQE